MHRNKEKNYPYLIRRFVKQEGIQSYTIDDENLTNFDQNLKKNLF